MHKLKIKVFLERTIILIVKARIKRKLKYFAPNAITLPQKILEIFKMWNKIMY